MGTTELYILCGSFLRGDGEETDDGKLTPARFLSSVKRRGKALRNSFAVPDMCTISRM